VRQVGLDLACRQLTDDDAARDTVHDDEVEHLVTRIEGYRAGVDLARQGLVGAEQELLPGLTAS
jgi:hypothetical protein